MNTLPNANSPLPAVARQGKMRLGIVSAHIFNQSVWLAILKGWVQEIDKSLFDVFLFKLGTEKDSETGKAAQHATHFDDAPKSTANWVEAIRGANLDALIFDEVGMDASTLQLASLRLVPLQCATWGHPETTGLSTIDAYISGEAIEPSNGQDNYRERLVKLPNLGVYVEPLAPKFVEPNLRELGLPKDEPLLLCAGSPFKYMPIHDWVWTEIARGLRDHGKGRLVFFSTSRGSMHVMLLDRLRRAFDQAGLEFDACVCVVPFLDRPRYFGVMRAATLMLDTLEFSGFNTAMQAIECDLPYLAFEGQFMRGRLASGLLRTMKLPELVANDYEQFVQRAVALSTNPELVSRLRTEIAARRHVLFHDSEPIRGLESFLATEIARRRKN
jgi:predicted O-linked N-acetylglucosamine transferase (SPINDLY family)